MNIACEAVSQGLRPSEALAHVRDVYGRVHYLRVERDFLDYEGESASLPVGLIHRDAETNACLVELPHEAETGARRIWYRHSKAELTRKDTT